jgi:hypothetical protein
MSSQLEKPYHYETRSVVIQLFQLTRHDTNSCTYTLCIYRISMHKLEQETILHRKLLKHDEEISKIKWSFHHKFNGRQHISNINISTLSTHEIYDIGKSHMTYTWRDMRCINKTLWYINILLNTKYHTPLCTMCVCQTKRKASCDAEHN